MSQEIETGGLVPVYALVGINKNPGWDDKNEQEGPDKHKVWISPQSVNWISPRKDPNECYVASGGRVFLVLHSPNQLIDIFKLKFTMQDDFE